MGNNKSEQRIAIAKIYLSRGLSVIPVWENKKPAMGWKQFQSNRMAVEDVNLNFKGQDVTGIALICGQVSGNLEVIDVDVKHDASGTLWADLSGLIRDNLPDLWERFVIAQTVSGGYHIYYRCPKIEGNKKLAFNSENEVIIETRGEGGYVCALPQPGYSFIQNKTDQIPEITPEDRNYLFAICRSLSVEATPESKKQPTTSTSGQNNPFNGLSPFDDYNQRADIVALLKLHGWSFVKQSGTRIHLKRPGDSKAETSANFDTTRRLFYVWSSSTMFEPGKAFNPVQVFTALECNGDFSEASRRLYSDGYGDRYERPETSTKAGIFPENRTLPDVENIHPLPFETPAETPLLPINGMPDFIREFIETCADVYKTPVDYWTGAAIMATALAIGTKIELKTKYSNVPILWMALIGDVSAGKTEAQDFCLRPFEELDSEAAKKFKEDYKTFEEIEGMSNKERAAAGLERIPKPELFQYIVKDATPEALTMVHSVNQRGLLISRDELKGWLDDFGRYSKSGEQSNMLSSFNRVRMVTNRKGGGLNSVLDIPKPCILVFGGLQPDLLPTLAADNRQENGFLARFCCVWPGHSAKPAYCKKTVPEDFKKQWADFIKRLVNIPGELKITLSDEAENLYLDWFEKNRTQSNSTESGYLKGVFGKLDIIALRVAVVVFGMYYGTGTREQTLSGEVMATALEITEYFRATGMKVYNKLFAEPQQPEKKDLIKTLSKMGASQNKIADALGVTQQYVSKILKK